MALGWNRTRLGILLIGVSCFGGCAINPPPSIEPRMPRRGITPRSYNMKLAVFNLQDPIDTAGRLTESVAEMLHVALFDTGQFELIQRAELQGIDPGDIKGIKERYRRLLDALVVGSITSFNTSDRTMTIQVSVMNPDYGTTMAARAFSVRYAGTINVDVNREDVIRVAEWIQREFPKLDAGLVLSHSSDRITINLGSDAGVQVGMWVLIAARGNTIKDPQSGELLGSDIYVGEACVIGLSPGTCTARLIPDENGKLPQIKVHDKVIFK